MHVVGLRLPLGRPILCLVSNRRRLAASLGGGVDSIEAVVTQVHAAVEADIDLVQIREPDLSDRQLVNLVTSCLEVTRGTQTRVLVNGRLDIALAVGAAGVHLRSDSISACQVRELVPVSFLVGRSVHDVAETREVVAAGGLDYLIYGTVRATVSKPGGHRLSGFTGLARAVQVADVPVLAIGGITERELPMVKCAGAAGFAAIGFFMNHRAPGGYFDLREQIGQARKSFNIG